MLRSIPAILLAVVIVGLPGVSAWAQTAPATSYPKLTDDGEIGAPGEDPVDPYDMSNDNAGATPFKGDRLFKAFHGQDGISRIVDDLVDRNVKDPLIGEIFKPFNLSRLRRTLKEQFCYILNGPCAYTGRTMKDSHEDMGLQVRDFDRLVENLQAAMSKEGVSFRAQNMLLAKLAPMKDETVER